MPKGCELKKSNITAIFDVDKTLVDGYSIIDFAKYLTDLKSFKVANWFEIESGISDYRKRLVDYNKFANIVVTAYGQGLIGQKRDELLKHSEKFWQSRFEQVYPFVKELFNDLKSKQIKTVAISGSDKLSLAPFLDKFQFDKSYLTDIEFDSNNVCTGQVSKNMASHNFKKEVVLDILNDIQGKTIGFGDSVADLAFLELVDIPVVVGIHDKELNQVAIKQNWHIIQDPNVFELAKITKLYF